MNGLDGLDILLILCDLLSVLLKDSLELLVVRAACYGSCRTCCRYSAGTCGCRLRALGTLSCLGGLLALACNYVGKLLYIALLGIINARTGNADRRIGPSGGTDRLSQSLLTEAAATPDLLRLSFTPGKIDILLRKLSPIKVFLQLRIFIYFTTKNFVR